MTSFPPNCIVTAILLAEVKNFHHSSYLSRRCRSVYRSPGHPEFGKTPEGSITIKMPPVELLHQQPRFRQPQQILSSSVLPECCFLHQGHRVSV